MALTLTNCSRADGEIVPVPFDCIHHAILHYARLFPGTTAVEDHTGASISYSELDRLSALLADQLRSRGVHRGARVCLVVSRSIPHIIALLAVLRAGAAYVPLDGALATEVTLRRIVEDASPAYVLVSRVHEQQMRSIDTRYECIESLLEAYVSHTTASIPEDVVGPNDGAYVIYTSGTTGMPKGVCVSHRNVTNLICLSPGNLGICPGTTVAQLLNVAFDMAAWEILGALSNGGTLLLRGPRRADWLATLRQSNVVIATPSILSQHRPQDFPTIRVVAVGGEPCPQGLADAWAAHVSAFYNACGPTEVTIVNTMHLHTPGRQISIGIPTPNNAVYILDDAGRPVAQGKPGVMWAAGRGVCDGYLNRPELTEARFRPDPFVVPSGGEEGSKSAMMMFNTGDIGRRRADGCIEHLGRVDDQVKIQGFRVELDGVSVSMLLCKPLTTACALLIDSTLWGFYTPVDVPPETVLATVALVLPPYAVPTRYLPMVTFPLTRNGKIDKRRLRELAVDHQTRGEMVHQDQVDAGLSVSAEPGNDLQERIRKVMIEGLIHIGVVYVLFRFVSEYFR
ncbi:AMP-binding protein [Trametopsis cervina]|nr:AMP-binding protein [Trametopsis cervina]